MSVEKRHEGLEIGLLHLPDYSEEITSRIAVGKDIDKLLQSLEDSETIISMSELKSVAFYMMDSTIQAINPTWIEEIIDELCNLSPTRIEFFYDKDLQIVWKNFAHFVLRAYYLLLCAILFPGEI